MSQPVRRTRQQTEAQLANLRRGGQTFTQPRPPRSSALDSELDERIAAASRLSRGTVTDQSNHQGARRRARLTAADDRDDEIRDKRVLEEFEQWGAGIEQELGYLRRLGAKQWLVPGWQYGFFSDEISHFSLDSNIAYCTCSLSPTCIHTLAYRSKPELFTRAPSLVASDPLPSVIPFAALAIDQELAFSVRQTQQTADDSGKRVIVALTKRKWAWKCSGIGCRGKCEHIKMAKAWLDVAVFGSGRETAADKDEDDYSAILDA